MPMRWRSTVFRFSGSHEAEQLKGGAWAPSVVADGCGVVGPAGFAEETDCGVAQRGQDLRGGSAADLAVE